MRGFLLRNKCMVHCGLWLAGDILDEVGEILQIENHMISDIVCETPVPQQESPDPR